MLRVPVFAAVLVGKTGGVTFNSEGKLHGQSGGFPGQGYKMTTGGEPIEAPEDTNVGTDYGRGAAGHGLDYIVTGKATAGYVLHQDHDGMSNFGQHRGPLWYSGTSGKTGGSPEACGAAAAIWGHLAVVGCPCDGACPAFSNAGRALVFGRNNGGTGHWGHITGVVGAEALAMGQFYTAGADRPECGASVAIWDGIIAVGCPGEQSPDKYGTGDEDDAGAVYLFDAGSGYSLVRRFTAVTDGALAGVGAGGNLGGDEAFGTAVALDGFDATSGVTLAVGCERCLNTADGALLAFLQNHPTGGADSWQHLQTLEGQKSPAVTSAGQFARCGKSVAVAVTAAAPGNANPTYYAMGCNPSGAGIAPPGYVLAWIDDGEYDGGGVPSGGNPLAAPGAPTALISPTAGSVGRDAFGRAIDFLHGRSFGATNNDGLAGGGARDTVILGVGALAGDTDDSGRFCVYEGALVGTFAALATECVSGADDDDLGASVDGSFANFIVGSPGAGKAGVLVQDCVCGNGFTDQLSQCAGVQEQCDDGHNYDDTDGCLDTCGISAGCLDGRQIYECYDDGTETDLLAETCCTRTPCRVQDPQNPCTQATTSFTDVVGQIGDSGMPLQCNNNDGDTGCMSLNRCRQKEEVFIDPTVGLITLGYCAHVQDGTNPFQVSCSGVGGGADCDTTHGHMASKTRGLALTAGNLPAGTQKTRIVTARIPLGFIAGDPHFISFSGGKYEVSGVPDHVYNIISDATVQFNGKFVAGSSNSTWIGEAGFLFNGHQLAWDAAEDHAVFDGQPVSPVSKAGGRHCLDDDCAHYFTFWKGRHPAPPRLDVALPGYRVHLTRKHAPRVLYWNRRNYWNSLKGTGTHHYGNRPFYFDHQIERIQTEQTAKSHPHGLLGQTARLAHPVARQFDALGRPARNGEGVIEGSVHDYEVSSIYGTDFKFNQFA